MVFINTLFGQNLAMLMLKVNYTYQVVKRSQISFMFEFPCIISLYYIKSQQDATLVVLFISNWKITLHVSDAFWSHHQEY